MTHILLSRKARHKKVLMKLQNSRSKHKAYFLCQQDKGREEISNFVVGTDREVSGLTVLPRLTLNSPEHYHTGPGFYKIRSMYGRPGWERWMPIVSTKLCGRFTVGLSI